jgi:hypothetical protein
VVHSRRHSRKLEPKATTGYLVGYYTSSKAWCTYIPLTRKVIESLNVHLTNGVFQPKVLTLPRLTPRLTSLKRIILFPLPRRQPTTSSTPSSDSEGGILVSDFLLPSSEANSVDLFDLSSFIQFNHDPFDDDDNTGSRHSADMMSAASPHSQEHLHTGSSCSGHAFPPVPVPVPAPMALPRAPPAPFHLVLLGAMLLHLHICEIMLSMSPRGSRNLLLTAMDSVSEQRA